MSSDFASTETVRRSPVPAIAVTAATCGATVAVFVPQLVVNAGQVARWPDVARFGWLVLAVVLPPLVAYVVARRHCGRPGAHAAALAGIPLPLLGVGLAALDAWLEVRSGYLLADSGEEAMAYGLGTILGTIYGLVLLVLVATAATLGVRNRGPARAAP